MKSNSDHPATAGAGLTTMQDIDGDGIFDLVVAAPHDDPQFSATGELRRRGALHVLSGATRMNLRTVIGDDGYTFGEAVSLRRNDLNQDGFYDMLVISGSLTAPVDDMTEMMHSAMFSVISPTDGDTLEQSIGAGLASGQGLRSDVNKDGFVDIDDLLDVIASIGQDGVADINRDGVVDSADLLIVMADLDMDENLDQSDMGPPSPIFGPGHGTCAGVADATLKAFTVYLLGCAMYISRSGGLLIPPFCAPQVFFYGFVGSIAFVSATCLIDGIF